mmetsp:Transcript_13201/g.37209  ORF Transcript_13201/g.37209 Transcript_13201/m.37209 type:complete len:2067 (+) Transcript_13201:204-6404(+)
MQSGDGMAPLQAGVMSPARLQDTAFEVFVKRAMRTIMDCSTGRSAEAKKIREACQKFMDSVNRGDGEGPKFVPPLTGISRDQVMEPLRLACKSDMPKVMQPALGCIHKLVGHAYLQGESSPAGKLDDPNLVSQTLAVVAKCGEKSTPGVQLAVLRALLTLTTAEHFILHGDCLLQAVRTVFNLTIGSENLDIQRTAKNSLLQMLNTIVKRVTCYSHLAGMDACSSGAQTPVPFSETGESGRSHLSISRRHSSTGVGLSPRTATPHRLTEDGGSICTPPVLELSSRPSTGPPTPNGHPGIFTPQGTPPEPSTPPAVDLPEISVIQEADDRPRGSTQDQVKAAINMLTPLATPDKPPRPEDRQQAAEGHAEGCVSSPGKAAHLMNLAEQHDIEGLEAAFAQDDGVDEPGLSRSSSLGADKLSAHDKSHAWRELTVWERDVVTVLGALCKLAAREGTSNDQKEVYLHQGKLLALDMLVACISSPVHQWTAVRPQFVSQLRQALCVTLLRNSTSNDIDCVRYVTRLFSGLLLQPPLRSVMKAELGAFYPLLILRPMQAVPYDPPQLAAALQVLQELCRESNLQVEMFINFDCELEESNLFERTTWCLKELVDLGDPSAPQAQNQLVKMAALSCVLSLIKGLDAWAGPMRDRIAATAASGGVVSSNSETNLDNLRIGGGLDLNNSIGSMGSHGEASEAERFGTAKHLKTTVEAGLNLFNRKPLAGISSLVSSGIIEDNPESIAQFLRKHRKELDKTQLGEYFGHHEDAQIAVMHAYIDDENFSGQRIDDALRSLLGHFRLPGEAQKIDRIMEKFAERYCKDNPGVFRTADAAYMLSFAIIMLNTDAHNPMVDEKMSREDFVLMNAACSEPEDGGVEGEGLVLPVEELNGIYERIQASEIKMRDDGSAQSSQLSNRRLAAAIGLGGLMLPFRSARQAAREQREQVAMVLSQTRRMVSQSIHRSSMWHFATQAEMTVPMMEVAGDNLQQALFCALSAAETEEQCLPVIEGFNIMIRLCALLGMEGLCDKLVESLVLGTGIPSELAPPSEPRAHGQMAALKALVLLAGAPESGALGSAWTHILRCLSSLDMMVHNSHYSVSSAREDASLSMSPAPGNTAIGRVWNWMRGSGATAGRSPSQLGSVHSHSKSAPELFQGSSTLRSVDWQITKGKRAATPSRTPVPRQAVLGAAQIAWAEGEGSAEVERVFAGSAKMDGESVVVFVRAMCAVSQEELDDSARVYMLQKLVECAHHNLGRIRLIWSRLWGALTPHIVGASCHPDLKVAMYAVDSLRQLVSKLLVRAELAHFTHQEEALRPFCSILKSCDSPVVRELTVQCIAQAITAHPRGLGSGWRSVLEALEVAATDYAPPVVEQALEALQPVVEALYRGLGLRKEFFTDCLQAAMAVVLNKHHPDLSLDGFQIFRNCARRLGEASKEGEAAVMEASDESTSHPHSLKQGPSEAEGGLRYIEGEEEEEPSSIWLRRHEMWQQEKNEWAQLMGALVDVAVQDGREKTAATAINTMFDLLLAYSSSFTEETWLRIHDRALSNLFELPPANLRPLHYLPDKGVAFLTPWAVQTYDRVTQQAPLLLPRLYGIIAERYGTTGKLLLGLCSNWLVQYIMAPWEAVCIMGVRMLQVMATTLAPVLDSDGWNSIIRSLSAAAGADVLQPLSGVPSIYTAHVSRLPSICRQPPAATQAAGSEGVGAVEGSSGLELPAEAKDTPGRYIVDISQAIRVRSRAAVLCQRTIELIHRTCSSAIPKGLQLSILDVLLDTVNRASALNAELARRHATGTLLKASPLSLDSSPLGDRGLFASFASAGAFCGPSEVLERTASGSLPTPSAGMPAPAAEGTDSPSASSSGRGFDVELRASEWISVEESLLPALMRQEAEGGVLALRALSRCLSLEDCEVAAGAEERLLSLASRMIRTAAEEARRHTAAESLDGLPGPTTEKTDHVPGLPQALPVKMETSMDEAVPQEGLLSSAAAWDEGIRAPLVVSSLAAMQEVQTSSLHSEFKQLFPFLTQLICSSQHSVRQAVSSLLQAQLPQMLPPNPAAARTDPEAEAPSASGAELPEG